MTNVVRYEGEAVRGLSAFWANILKQRDGDPSRVALYFDDFDNFGQEISAQNIAKYASYIDVGVTVKASPVQSLVNGEFGVLEIAGNDADNDEGSIITGGNSGTLALISKAAGASKLLAFECRVKKASVADNACAFFAGLSEEALAAADTLVDNTGELADKDFVGFRVLHDNGEEVDFAWRKAGAAVQEVAVVGSMAADTWVKLGFLYDPDANATKRIRIFVNGAEVGAVTNAQCIAVTFPDGEELAMLLATKVGAAAESKFQMDWWAVGQILD
jgi:hypothetical protein